MGSRSEIPAHSVRPHGWVWGPGGCLDITFGVVKLLLAQSQPGPLSKAHRIDFSTWFLFVSQVFDGPVTHSQPCQNFLHLDNICMTNAYDTWGGLWRHCLLRPHSLQGPVLPGAEWWWPLAALFLWTPNLRGPSILAGWLWLSHVGASPAWRSRCVKVTHSEGAMFLESTRLAQSSSWALSPFQGSV